MTNKPILFLLFQGLSCDWSKHNKHSRNIFSVHGFLSLGVKLERLQVETGGSMTTINKKILDFFREHFRETTHLACAMIQDLYT